MIAFSSSVQSDMLTKRGITQVQRICNRLVMVEHKIDILPLHFQNVPEARPGGEWDYARRGKGYEISKARETGHRRPLVFSGELERSVLSSAKVTATQDRGRLTARGSRASQLRGPLRQEIEAVGQRDEKRKAQRWADLFVTLAQQPRFRKRTRTRNARGQFTK